MARISGPRPYPTQPRPPAPTPRGPRLRRLAVHGAPSPRSFPSPRPQDPDLKILNLLRGQQTPSVFLEIPSDSSSSRLPRDPRCGARVAARRPRPRRRVRRAAWRAWRRQRCVVVRASVGGKGTNGRPAARQRAAADGHTSCVAVGLLGATMPGDHCMFCQSQQLTL